MKKKVVHDYKNNYHKPSKRKSFKIRALFLPLLLLLCVFLILNFFTSQDIKAATKQLVFAGSHKFAPYSFSSGGRPSGYSVDLMKILSATINRDIAIKLTSWENCISALKRGEVDGIIGIPVNEEYKEYLDYSTPVAEIDFAIFVDAGNTYINSMESLEGTVVGVYEGCLITSFLEKDKRIQLLKTESSLEALIRLKNREISAVVAAKNVGLYYIQKKKIEGLKIVGDPVGPTYEYAIAIRKGETRLLKNINRGITILEENSTLYKLKRKWFGIRLGEPFPWRMVFLLTGGITGIMLILVGILWAISLNATVKIKTQQIQLMNQKIVEKDKLAVLGQLAGQIAHELRTPLGIINSSIYLLRKEGSENKELFEKRLHILEEKSQLSSDILESILSYSRVKAEVATTVSVKKCLNKAIKDIHIHKGIRQNISVEKQEQFLVFIDFHQLYSVLRNLVLNAVQAMETKGTLTIDISSSTDKSTVNVRVCNTGPGIEESVKDKIFNLFYSSKITGTGLGLPISKSIIETNGGELYLEETSKERTSFMIKLPLAKI